MLLIIIPGVPALFQAVFNVPDIALSSSMACRVFRNLKFSARYQDNLGIEWMLPFSDPSASTTGDINAEILRAPAQNPAKSETFNMQDL